MRGDRIPRLILVVSLVVALCGVVLVTTGVAGPRDPQREGAVTPVTGSTIGGAAHRPPGRSDPVRLDIPAIGVHAGLAPLGLRPDHSVAVPPLDSRDAGWYEYGPAPGEIGPAVVLGHVDSARTGPGVFSDLRTLVPGDTVRVTRTDGTVVAFRVDRVERFPKSSFPTAAVYGDIDRAGLRLITCGGAFDRSAHSYLDNVVVFASAAT